MDNPVNLIYQYAKDTFGEENLNDDSFYQSYLYFSRDEEKLKNRNGVNIKPKDIGLKLYSNTEAARKRINAILGK